MLVPVSTMPTNPAQSRIDMPTRLIVASWVHQGIIKATKAAAVALALYTKVQQRLHVHLSRSYAGDT